MKTNVGVWIDHRKAIVVAITDKGEETRLIISKVERQLRRSGDSPLEGAYDKAQTPARNSRQRTFTTHLNIYYDAVVACIRDAEAILIFGPGEAKGELEKRLTKSHLDGRIVGIGTVDKMTDHQIAAKVRQHFQDAVGPRQVREGERAGSRSGQARFRAGRPINAGRVTPHREGSTNAVPYRHRHVREHSTRRQQE